jgi:hypothetical protein
MKTIQVVPARVRQNRLTGAKITMFSTLPYGSAEDWLVVEQGYTWEIVDFRGCLTVGMGRKPAKTIEEAEAQAVGAGKAMGYTVLEPRV